MAVHIVFETHSTSTHNEAGVASGWLPGELSETGRRQAAALGARRRHDGLAAVFTSDLRRAVETGEVAFRGSDVPMFQDARLRECNYGELNGMPSDQLQQRSRHIDVPFPAGQSYRDVVTQTADFLQDLALDWDGRRVLIISHSANRWALDCLLGGKQLVDLVDAPFDWQEGWEYLLPTGWTAPEATPRSF